MKILLLIILFLNFSLSQFPEDCINKDKYQYEYVYNYLTYFKNNLNPLKMTLYSEEDNEVLIFIPKRNLRKIINLNSGEVYEEVFKEFTEEFKLDINIENILFLGDENFNITSKDGIYIYSVNHLNVNFIKLGNYEGDATNIFSNIQSGIKYRLNKINSFDFQNSQNGESNSDNVSISSFYENNEITIEYVGNNYDPNSTTNYFKKKFSLNKGENIRFTTKGYYDISGYEVTSKFPIQIIIGSQVFFLENPYHLIQIPNDNKENDIMHFVFPNKYLGNYYILIPYNRNNIYSHQKGFYYKIVPLENDTELKINNINKGIFNKNEYYVEYSEEPIFINTDKKISVTQYNTGYFYQTNIGQSFYYESSHPNMLQALPVRQMNKDYNILVTHFRENRFGRSFEDRELMSDSAFVNILAYKDDDVFIDDKLVDNFINIPNSEFKYKSHFLEFGSYNIKSNKGTLTTILTHTPNYHTNFLYNGNTELFRDDAVIIVNNNEYEDFICFDSSFKLSTDAPIGTLEYEWTINDTLRVEGKDVELILPEPGEYNIKLKLDNDDEKVYEWTVTRLQKITSDLDSVIHLCNDSLSYIGMNVTGGGTSKSITWYQSENIKDPTKFDIEFIEPLKKSIKLYYEINDEHCCSYFDSVDIKITNLNPIITSTKSEFCQGDSATLSLDKEYELILWNTGETTKDIIVKDGGVYSATVTEGECTNETSIEIKVNPLPEIDILAPNGTILCDGGSIEIEVVVANGIGLLWNDGSRIKKRTFNESGTYTVTAKDINTDCEVTKEIVISDIGNTKAEILGINEICSNESTTLTITPQAQSYRWNTGETTQSIVVNQGGFYSVTITTEAGCELSDDIEVIEYPNPEFEIKGEKIICNNTSELYVEKSFESYLWSTGETERFIIVDEPGNYSVTITDINGCRAENEVEVIEFSPELNLSTNNIDFGEILFGEIRVQSITADKAIIISQDTKYYDATINNQQITFTFNPNDIGEFLDTLIVESQGDCKATDTIYIKGICKAEILAKVSNSEGYPNDDIVNKVSLELQQQIPLPKEFNYEIKLNINQDAIQIIDNTTFSYTNNKLEIDINDYLIKNNYNTDIKDINSKLMLARNHDNPIEIVNFTTDNLYLIPLRQDGMIKIYEVCIDKSRLIKHYNPAEILKLNKTLLTLNTKEEGTYSIDISDINGKSIYKKVENGLGLINFNYQLSNGSYLIKINEPGKSQTLKVIFME